MNGQKAPDYLKLFYRTSTLMVFVFAITYLIDFLMPVQKIVRRVEDLTVEVGGNPIRGTMGSGEFNEVLYINNDRLVISERAYNDIWGVDSLTLEKTGILNITRAFYLNPVRKYTPNNNWFLNRLLLFHVSLLIISFYRKGMRSFLPGFNILLLLIYLWLMFF